MPYLVALLMMAIVACGPGAAQIKTAKDAEYKASAATIFEP